MRVEPPQSPPFDRELTPPEVIIGRATTAGLVVPDSSMSRQHARLFHRDGRWWVEDLGATNGTSLNDHPLVEPTALGSGDRLRLGATVLRFAPAADDTTDPRHAQPPGRPASHAQRNPSRAGDGDLARRAARSHSRALFRRAASRGGRHPAQAIGGRVRAGRHAPAAGQDRRGRRLAAYRRRSGGQGAAGARARRGDRPSVCRLAVDS